MDPDTLKTASKYLNNLLLARGLLRNGEPLDFAKPSRETRAQTINLIHELLLRRDRDQENREHIALTLRTLRADETRKDGELEKLKTRMEDKDRALLQAQTESRNAKVEMRRVESSMKSVQDQLARLKASVSHIKTQCANDVRKRDMHIERLKTHLQGQQRGNKRGVVAPIMSITGGNNSHGRLNASVRDLQDPEYTLKQETNEFLTELGQSLSDENDGLIAMLHGTLRTMKELLGFDQDSPDADELDDSMAYESDPAPLSYDALAAELGTTMDVLKSVLTSPNFVSMDEVESRDEEILRLREGWERMEARWKEVLVMMNTWRAQMEKTGDTINLDDLKRGLGLGEGLDTLPPVHDPVCEESGEHAEEDTMASLRGDSGIGNRKPSSGAGDQPRSALEPPELFRQKPSTERHLRRTSPSIQSPRKVVFAADIAKSSPLVLQGRASSGTLAVEKSLSGQRPLEECLHPSGRDGEYDAPPSSQHERKDIFAESKIDLPNHTSPIFAEDEGDDQLTIEEKLQAAQLEADRAKSTIRSTDVEGLESTQLDLEIEEEISKVRSSPAKKSRIKGRPKRRKSTLSPEELENLLGLE